MHIGNIYFWDFLQDEQMTEWNGNSKYQTLRTIKLLDWDSSGFSSKLFGFPNKASFGMLRSPQAARSTRIEPRTSVAGKPSSTWSWLVFRFKFDSLFNQAKPSSRPISSLQAQLCYSHDLVAHTRRASKLPATRRRLHYLRAIYIWIRYPNEYFKCRF